MCPSPGNKEDEFRMPYLSHQQLPAGILPMVPEVAQAVGVSQGHHAKDFTRAAPNPAKATVTAMIARELLYGGTSPTAETILKNNVSSGHVPQGPLTRPSEQLDYLSHVQGFQVTVRWSFESCAPVWSSWAPLMTSHFIVKTWLLVVM
jgi:double-stranded RNA-binding protein Staufen